MKFFVDFYMVLGIPYNATSEQIKKAYKIQVKRYHPDVGGNPNEFLLIKEAYDVLNDVSLRSDYNIRYTHHLHQIRMELERNTIKTDNYSEQNNHHSPHSSNSTEKQKNKGRFSFRILFRMVGILAIILFISHLINMEDKISADPFTLSNEEYASAETNYPENLEEESTDESNEFIIDDATQERDSNLSEFSIENQDEHTTEESTTFTKENMAEIPITQPSNGSFTLGSSQEEVKAIMGVPTSVLDDSWRYEFSTIEFVDNKVVGWSNISNNLKVKLSDKIEGATFTIGSTKIEVLNAMGTPSSLRDDTWSYEF